MVAYVLTNDDELIIQYRVTTDRATPVNLTNHFYFNLASSGNILGHILTRHGCYYTELDTMQIPTSRILSVVGMPLDSASLAAISGRIGQVEIGATIITIYWITADAVNWVW